MHAYYICIDVESEISAEVEDALSPLTHITRISNKPALKTGADDLELSGELW